MRLILIMHNKTKLFKKELTNLWIRIIWNYESKWALIAAYFQKKMKVQLKVDQMTRAIMRQSTKWKYSMKL